MNCMEIVGSEIFWNGMASGFSGEQRVSPMEISVIPDTATIEPIVASLLYFVQTVKFIQFADLDFLLLVRIVMV